MGIFSKLKHHAKKLMGNGEVLRQYPHEDITEAVDVVEHAVDTAKKAKKGVKKAKSLVTKKVKKKAKKD
jgi:hypothetical protein